MIKIISERHRESHTEYSLQFDLIGNVREMVMASHCYQKMQLLYH